MITNYTDQQLPAVGDVVRLKSGGPMMTVLAEGGANDITCCWFSEVKTEFPTLRLTTFPTTCLVKEESK